MKSIRYWISVSLINIKWRETMMQRNADSNLSFVELGPYERLLNKAASKTGLSDWGDHEFMKPLQLLLKPRTDRYKLTFFGEKMIIHNVMRCLKNRLLIQKELKAHPEIRNEPIQKPLFITGLPRTGTTLLQNLLAQDPNSRTLLFWEALEPAPAPEPATHETDPRVKKAKILLKIFLILHPSYKTAYNLDAKKPAECLGLLANTFVKAGPLFYSVADYQRGLDWGDAELAYREYKQQLQILQWKFPKKRWVLKAPAHLGELDTILKVFPDANIILTHRNLKEVLPSLTSLFMMSRKPSNRFGKEQLSLAMQEHAWIIGNMINKALSVRNEQNESHFIDICYKDLTMDPIQTVKKIYEYFHYPYSVEFEARIQQWLKENPQGKHGRHNYSIYQKLLTDQMIEDNFSKYNEQFHL
jgi:hypothetical protein